MMNSVNYSDFNLDNAFLSTYSVDPTNEYNLNMSEGLISPQSEERINNNVDMMVNNLYRDEPNYTPTIQTVSNTNNNVFNYILILILIIVVIVIIYYLFIKKKHVY